MEAFQANMDLFWVLVASFLVFIMQAGFTMLETGFVRAKNSVNIAMKNVLDFLIATLFFYGVGFAIMFGNQSASGFFGVDGFFLSGFTSPSDQAFFIFQLMFAGTAATIVSGAVAERMSFKGYALISLMVTALVYPVSGHWIWNGEGWLAQMGFMDFAGSTVVHSLGAWVGLVGTWMIGARHGRFDEEGNPKEIPNFNLTLVTLGVFLLWFGWFGFNGGSTLEANGQVPSILLNTILASAAGGFGAFLISTVLEKHASVSKMLNGVLGGLVAITAGCAYVGAEASLLIGVLGGALVYLGEDLLLKMGIDDPIGAVPVHGMAGAFGTLVIPFAAPAAVLAAGDFWSQLEVQLIGVLAVMAWAVVTAAVIFGFLKKAGLLRISLEDEIVGLNISEHGVKMSWLDTINTTRRIIEDGDYTKRVEVEEQTEAGEVGAYFNTMLDDLQGKIQVLDKISRGWLETGGIRPKSDRDVLSISMETMIANLKAMMENLEEKQQELRELNTNLELRVEDRTRELSKTLTELGNSNRLVMESIHYAGRIQNTLLPLPTKMDALLGDHFVIWMPRDVVGGDFYLVEETPEGFLAVVADCTGHGVPGALMTMIAAPAIQRIVKEMKVYDPSRILSLLHQALVQTLNRDGNSCSVDEGLEGAVLRVDVARKRAVYAGAGVPLFVTRDGRVEEFRADRYGIGSKRTPRGYRFHEREIHLEERMAFTMATDGITEQVGRAGSRKMMFGKKRFKRLLEEIDGLTNDEKRERILSTLDAFREEEKRRDDLTLLHFRSPVKL